MELIITKKALSQGDHRIILPNNNKKVVTIILTAATTSSLGGNRLLRNELGSSDFQSNDIEKQFLFDSI